MTKRIVCIAIPLLAAACGQREATPVPISVTPDRTLEYTWREGDTWRFLAWAVLDTEGGEGHEALALTSGYPPETDPAPGAIVRLPLDPSMSGALESRLDAARLVREATGLFEGGDPSGSATALLEAISRDPQWSVPRYDLALILLGEGLADSARTVLEPVSMKPRAAALLGFLSWEEGDVRAALGRLEEAIATEDPPAEAIASAAIAYMVSGDAYLATRLWFRLLQDPSAPSELRLMAVRFCLMEE